MRRWRVISALYTVGLLCISSVTACDLCFLDPHNAACKAVPPTPGAGANPTRFLKVDPDTIWLVRPGVSANAVISLVSTATDSAAYRLTMSSLPAGLFASFKGSAVARNSSVSLEMGIVSTYSGTDRIDFYGDIPSRQVRGALIVTTAKPFTLGYSGPAISVAAGSSVTVPFSVLRAAGFGGDVLLGAGVRTPNVGTSVTAGSSPTTGGTATISVGSNVTPGLHTLVLDGTYKSFFDTLAVPVIVTQAADFSLALSPNRFTLVRSGGAQATLSINRIVSQVGAITLVQENVPNGLVVNFSSNPATAGIVGIGITATQSMTAGIYTVGIAGTWNNITRRTTFIVEIIDPDYAITPSPSPVTIPRSGARTISAAIHRLSPLIQTVDLSKQNEPPGIVATFPNGTATYQEAGNTTALDVAVAASVPPGTYTFQLVGNALGVRRTADVVVIVTNPPISVSLSPPALSLRAGQSGQTLLSVGGLGYMQSGVTVRVLGPLPAGITAMVSPLPTSFSNFVIDVTTAASVAAGIYAIPIHVIHLGVTYAATLTLTIQ